MTWLAISSDYEFYLELYRCPECGALVEYDDVGLHQSWHKKQTDDGK